MQSKETLAGKKKTQTWLECLYICFQHQNTKASFSKLLFLFKNLYKGPLELLKQNVKNAAGLTKRCVSSNACYMNICTAVNGP